MKITKLKIFLMILISIILYSLWGNTALEVNHYVMNDHHIPESFNGYKIAHISDVHNTNNKDLIPLLIQSKPDIIAITGDLIDSRNTNIEIALEFVREAMKIAPCYYVTGNHEARVNEYLQLRNGLIELGVIVLENQKVDIIKENKITLIGLNDPSFETNYLFGDDQTIVLNDLDELKTEDNYTILLSHRPELFEIYESKNINLVLSGHAHGGQFRLPFIGGMIAPNQGLFPKYDSGKFIKNDTTMFVSRGIGNSIFPLRLNNRPEIIIIEFNNK